MINILFLLLVCPLIASALKSQSWLQSKVRISNLVTQASRKHEMWG